MNDSFKVYFDFLEKLGGELDTLTGIQQDKTNAVRQDDLMALNECMKREQAISLTLRTMEMERRKLLSGLGLADVPLSGLAESCPPEERARAREAADRLRARYNVYRSAADTARTLLEVNLRDVEKIIAERGLSGDNLPVNRMPGGSFTDIRA